MAEPNQEGNQDQGNQEPTPAAAPRMYSEAEVESRLRGQAKELERLKADSELLAKMKQEQETAKAKAAEERGEFKKLYEAQQAELARLKEGLDSAKKKRESYEELMSSEVRARVEAIEDKGHREKVEALLKGRDVLDQRSILSTFLSDKPAVDDAKKKAEPPKIGGAAGGKKPGEIDREAFARSSDYRKKAALAAMKNSS